MMEERMAAGDCRPATITIPATLIKPVDGRFGCGPSKVRPEQVDVAGRGRGRPTWAPATGRRRCKTTRSGGCASGLRDLFALPDGYEVVLGNGGTTAFWEVAAFGLVRDRAQFLSFGEFGGKFAKAVQIAPFLGEPTVRHVRPGRCAAVRAPKPASTSTLARTTRRRPVWRSPRTRVPGRRRCADDVRRDVGCRWAAGRPGGVRRLLLRAAEVASPPTVGCGSR